MQNFLDGSEQRQSAPAKVSLAAFASRARAARTAPPYQRAGSKQCSAGGALAAAERQAPWCPFAPAMWSLLPSCVHEPPRRRTRTCILAVRALLAPAKTLPRRGAQHLAPRGASTDIAQRKGVHKHLVADNFAAISTPKQSKPKQKTENVAHNGGKRDIGWSSAFSLQSPHPSIMAAAVASFDSGHADMVHDCALDFSGRRAASCGSDRLVKVFDLGGVGGGGAASAPVLLAEIAAHEGPVWAVAWAHPRFGTLLASASYDGTVAVHREAPAAAPATNVRGAPAATAASSSVVLATGAGSTSASRPGGGAWPRVLSFEGHAASVNGLAWAPQELGLCLATASADGKVAVITHHGVFCITGHERKDPILLS